MVVFSEVKRAKADVHRRDWSAGAELAVLLFKKGGRGLRFGGKGGHSFSRVARWIVSESGARLL